jgi:diguanylate cyclase (GGDEF)-like protein
MFDLRGRGEMDGQAGGFVEEGETSEAVPMTVPRETGRVFAPAGAGTSNSEKSRPHRAAADAVPELAGDAPADRSVRRGWPGTFSLAAFDLDGFADVSEVQGERSTEEVMDFVEALLASVLRSTDTIARKAEGGFVILLRNTPAAGAARAMEKAVRALQGEQFQLSSGRVETVRASVGVCGSDEAGSEARSREDMLEAAERRAERARAEGGGRIHWCRGEVLPSESTVVLLEDDVVTAGLIRHRLRRKGHRIVHLTTGTGALTRILAEKPSLIILNLNMGGLGGVEVIGRIRREPALRKVPILVLSKVESESDLIRSFQLGADEYIQKPFSTPELVARVHRLLRGR